MGGRDALSNGLSYCAPNQATRPIFCACASPTPVGPLMLTTSNVVKLHLTSSRAAYLNQSHPRCSQWRARWTSPFKYVAAVWQDNPTLMPNPQGGRDKRAGVNGGRPPFLAQGEFSRQASPRRVGSPSHTVPAFDP